MARLGFVDQEGNISHISSSSSYTPTKKKKKKDEEVTKDVRTVKTEQKKDDVRTVKTEDVTKKDNLKEALKQYDDAVKNSRVKNDGFSLSNAITDVANMYDAKRNIAKSLPVVGKAFQAQDKALSTAENVTTNLGTGALKAVEGAADTASDLVFNPLERRYNYAFDLITKGKKTADENLKDLKKLQQRDIKNSQTEGFQKATGYSDVVGEREKNSLVNRENLGGQIFQAAGGMVPALVLGQALGSIPELANTANLKGKEKVLANLGNVAKTYKSQLPANIMLGAQSYGGGVEEALNKGASMGQARGYGLANAAIEQGTELMTGGIPGLGGKGGIDNIIEPLINKGTKGYTNAALKALYGAFGEGLEEKTSTYLDALARQGILGDNINWRDVANESNRDFLIGALLGGTLNAPSSIQNIQDVRNEKINRGVQNGDVLNNNDNVIPDTNQIREIEEQKNNGEIDAEEANNRIADVQNGTYQQNQNNQAVIQEAQRQFNAIQQAEDAGVIDSEKANQERQVIINTMNQMTQPQQETQEEVVQETPKQEVKTNDNKAERVETPKIEVKNNVEVGKQYTYSNNGRSARYEVQEIRDDGNVVVKITSSNEPSLVGRTVTLKGDNIGLRNAQEYKSNIKYEDLSKDATATRYDKKMFAKAKNTDMDMSEYDRVTDFIIPNRAGNYSKQQILTIAEELGKKSKAKTGEELKQEAMNYWVNKEPYKKTDSKTKYLKIDEFLKAYYKGAGVGTKIETQEETPKTQEVKQERVEDKKDNSKVKQLEIINKNNPMQDEYHTGIRTENDIKTFEEAIKDDESFVWGDYSKEDAQRDLEKGTVTVYSSKPIEQGVFVSTSRNQARDYAGNNKVYSQEVPIEDVAWINGDEGQYAKISNETTQEPKVEQPKVEEKVEEPQKTKEELIQEYENKGLSEEGAKFLSEMPKPDKLSVRERIKQKKAERAEKWAYFKRNMVDKGEAIYSLSKKAKNRLLYAKYDKRGTTTGEANYDIGEAQTNLNGKKYNNFKIVNKNGKVVKTGPMSLNDIWEGIDTKVANEYIGHYLNVDRYKQTSAAGRKLIAELEAEVKAGKMTQQEMDEELKNYNTNRYVISPNFTDEMSMKKIKELEAVHPELKVFGENVWQYGKNQLQNMVDAGMVSQEKANKWLKETPHYVRLQREIPQDSTTTIVFDDNGNARVNQQVKEFKGSTLDILPFKETMAEYTLDVRNSIRDNIFAEELAKTLGMSSTGDTPTSVDDIMGIDPNKLKDNGDGTYSLTFYNKGNAVTIPIDQGIYEALQPNKHYEFEDKFPGLKTLRRVDTARKALLTDKNPMFLATNMMKDLFDAPLNSKHPIAFAKNYPKAVLEVVRNGKNFQQYKALGGLQNTYFEKNEGFKKPHKWDVIGRMNNAIEQFPRVAEFMSTMEKTGNIDEAMYNAAEITTNFKRGGDVAKAANRNGATFLNASIQGFSKQVRNFTDIQNPKQATQMLLKVLALGIAPALINDIAWGDDDDYKELQDYQKDRYYIIGKTKDGTFIRIPKGRAVSIFQSAARRTKYALGGDKKAFKEFVKFASSQVAPNNPIENNILSPVVDVYRNESWSGNEIIPQTMMEYTKTKDQFNEKTDKVSRKIGKALGKTPTLPEGLENFKSPMGINYLIDQYSGALGDISLPYITPKASSKSTNPVWKPLRDKFTGDFSYSNKNVNTFYEVQKELKKEHDTPIDEAKSSYMISKGRELSKLYNKQREIQSDNSLSNNEKYDKAKEVQKEINAFTKEAVKNVKNVQKEDYYLKIGNDYYKKVIDNGETVYKKDTSKKIPTEKYALYDYFREKYEKSKESKK